MVRKGGKKNDGNKAIKSDYRTFSFGMRLCMTTYCKHFSKQVHYRTKMKTPTPYQSPKTYENHYCST
jgi:hypothetical protein